MGMNVGCSASSPPLGKDPTSDRDPHHHGNGSHGRTCGWTEWKTFAIQVLQGVAGVVYMQKEQTQATLGNTMVSAHRVSIMQK